MNIVHFLLSSYLKRQYWNRVCSNVEFEQHTKLKINFILIVNTFLEGKHGA